MLKPQEVLKVLYLCFDVRSKLNSKSTASVAKSINHYQPVVGGGGDASGGAGSGGREDIVDDHLLVLSSTAVVSTRRALIPRRKTRSPPVRSCRHSNNKNSI